MTAQQIVTVDRDRVNALMRAFRYGERVEGLEKVDARRDSGHYDKVAWHVALDGATLNGYSTVFRRHLVAALESGMSEKEAEETAYRETAQEAGLE